MQEVHIQTTVSVASNTELLVITSNNELMVIFSRKSSPSRILEFGGTFHVFEQGRI